ncbi:subtilisin-like serine protease-like protein PR1A [Paraphaeosphaeria sporulosa]|uniref:Subtilisin-like serine protease-like protein PR1A n=1 Tax=Paraphaeosphaeria sporulosa TaxID=1460663 RepID=A0A177CYG6_9PLEO|nr:subtilisin-like serine protease-like protein PR1A [Paraphaeosphaeria sporulosa]OAG12296.1 subtilisin-like serine protease-like protein PR1A [Paraphaeosphaeria sporulosa]
MRLDFITLAALPLVLGAPVVTPRSGQVIPGRYIVKFKDSDFVTSAINSVLALLPAAPAHTYTLSTFKGFAGELSDELVNVIAALPNVEYIEKDAIVKITQWEEDVALDKRALTTQSGAPWGLGRISHVAKGSTSYVYDTTAGADTCSYVIDTGIYTAHSDFGGRATFLANYAGDGSNTDGNGHGTHVAGTIGSNTYGIAKNTKLYAVKVLDASGSGTNSGVIAGINFVASDVKTRSCPKGAVANMSLGGSKSTAVNTAAAGVVSAGVFLAVAAGNEAQAAANTSPASEPTVFTVGATDSSDAFATFSNYGSSVDGNAPGVSVLSTWNNGGTNTISGTSMASPHVAGLGAYLLSLEGKVTPAALTTRIQSLSNKNKITSIKSGTVNYLVYNGNGA